MKNEVIKTIEKLNKCDGLYRSIDVLMSDFTTITKPIEFSYFRTLLFGLIVTKALLFLIFVIDFCLTTILVCCCRTHESLRLFVFLNPLNCRVSPQKTRPNVLDENIKSANVSPIEAVNF